MHFILLKCLNVMELFLLLKRILGGISMPNDLKYVTDAGKSKLFSQVLLG